VPLFFDTLYNSLVVIVMTLTPKRLLSICSRSSTPTLIAWMLFVAMLLTLFDVQESSAQSRRSRSSASKSKKSSRSEAAQTVKADEKAGTIGALLHEYPFEVKKIRVKRADIAYMDEGSGEEVLLFIHGLNGYAPIWGKQLAILKERYRCVAVDLPGYGRSSKGRDFPMSIFSCADLLVKFMDALKLQRVTLVGHSMGGQIALNMAMRYAGRVKKMVLVAPTGLEPFSEKERQAFHDNVTEELTKNKTEEQIQNDFRKLFYQIPADSSANFLLKDRLAIREASDFSDYCVAVKQSILGVIDMPTYDMLDGVPQSTLLMFGHNDGYIPNPFFHVGQKSEEIAAIGKQRLRYCKVIMLPKCGHLAQLEQPEAVNKAILDFVK